jgi:TrmH family RNA methyltransferase
MPDATERARTARIVQSRHNVRVKELRRAFAQPGRGERGLVAIEGELLLGEAVRSGLVVETVFVRSGSEAVLERLTLEAGEVLELPADVFASAVETESPQGIAALVAGPQFGVEEIFPERGAALVLVMAGLQDPGNVGTLIRSAEAFGASGAVLLPGTVNVWNAKAVRASAGSVFRLPVVSLGLAEMMAALQERGVRLLAAAADGDVVLSGAGLEGPVAVVIGNEGAGVPAEVLAAADARVAIRCPGPVESLNAGIAGSILLYEAARQRGGVVGR